MSMEFKLHKELKSLKSNLELVGKGSDYIKKQII